MAGPRALMCLLSILNTSDNSDRNLSVDWSTTLYSKKASWKKKKNGNAHVYSIQIGMIRSQEKSQMEVIISHKSFYSSHDLEKEGYVINL